MNKKYKLVIPEMIPLHLSNIATALKLNCKLFGEIRENEKHKLYDKVYKFDDIPKKWLQEIEDGPVSSYEVAVACLKANELTPKPSAFEVSLVTEGEKNDRKRTQPVIDAAKGVALNPNNELT
jgi:hypothetical protein